ncbi:hypothetical protein C8Q76DRAFT_135662 [Earliella scabrosa]|nr:hypothetical protein C8Q76DRAFT_135662 [Earliella scabrosa]
MHRTRGLSMYPSRFAGFWNISGFRDGVPPSPGGAVLGPSVRERARVLSSKRLWRGRARGCGYKRRIGLCVVRSPSHRPPAAPLALASSARTSREIESPAGTVTVLRLPSVRCVRRRAPTISVKPPHPLAIGRRHEQRRHHVLGSGAASRSGDTARPPPTRDVHDHRAVRTSVQPAGNHPAVGRGAHTQPLSPATPARPVRPPHRAGDRIPPGARRAHTPTNTNDSSATRGQGDVRS